MLHFSQSIQQSSPGIQAVKKYKGSLSREKDSKMEKEREWKEKVMLHINLMLPTNFESKVKSSVEKKKNK